MNNFFNPFYDFDNEKTQHKQEIKQNNINNINNLNPYTSRVAHRYLCNTNSNKASIFNLIKTSNLSDEYSTKIIKYLYKNMDDKNKQELLKFFSDEI